jgi:serine/threonine protein kinase
MSQNLSDAKISKLQRMLAGPAMKPSAASSREATPAPKGQIGKYKLLRMLAPQTWEASDGKRPNSLVLHVVGGTKDPAVVNAVCADLRPLATLQHPVIVTYHKLSAVNDGYFTVRDYVAGESLEKSPVDPVSALQILYEVARALEFTHERGLVHGALTPANIILSPTGRPFVVDFAARQIRARFLSGVTTRLEPQQDLDALRALFLSLLSGMAFTDVIVAETRPPNRPVDPSVDAMLAEMAAKEYATAAAFADDLGQVLQTLPSDHTTSVGLLERYKRRERSA